MVIALLTDFGDSHYVGQMRGVILTVFPDELIVDISHSVPRHCIISGAWQLLQSFREFPKGTVFVGVVDPGVGGKRKCIAVRSSNYFFVGPDNGLLFPAAASDGIVESVVIAPEKLDNETGKRDVSSTFHGRDVFARAAAVISRTGNLLRVGKSAKGIRKLDIFPRKREGIVVDVDSFGNVVTNVLPGRKRRGTFRVAFGKNSFEAALRKTFSELGKREVGLVVGSSGTFEVVANRKSAAEILGVNIGDSVRIR